MEEEWKSEAACAGMGPASADDDDVFFPGRGRGDLRQLAKDICKSCPVIQECRDYRQITDSKHGIWAGETKMQ